MDKVRGLDIDGVLADFSAAAISRAKKMGFGDYFPKDRRGHNYWGLSEKFSEVMKDAWLDPTFWLALKPISKEVPFEVNCYVTARPIGGEVTKKWLQKHGFPEAEVITVSDPADKIQCLMDRKVDTFVDDLYTTVISLREAGINALLFKAPYQKGHIEECAGLPTIETLEEVKLYE